jgi:hypothetical protein
LIDQQFFNREKRMETWGMGFAADDVIGLMAESRFHFQHRGFKMDDPRVVATLVGAFVGALATAVGAVVNHQFTLGRERRQLTWKLLHTTAEHFYGLLETLPYSTLNALDKTINVEIDQRHIAKTALLRADCLALTMVCGEKGQAFFDAADKYIKLPKPDPTKMQAEQVEEFHKRFRTVEKELQKLWKSLDETDPFQFNEK